MSAPVRAVVHAMEPRPLLRAEEERLLLARVHGATSSEVPPAICDPQLHVQSMGRR